MREERDVRRSPQVVQGVPGRVQQPGHPDPGIGVQAAIGAVGDRGGEDELPRPEAAATEIGGTGPTPRGSILEPVLRWMQDNAHADLTLADIAEQAGMSTRTLNRRVREQADTTPLQWLHRARIRQAQYLLEATDHPVDRIARQVGFSSPTAFRDHFKRIVGTGPHAYRSAFHDPRPEHQA